MAKRAPEPSASFAAYFARLVDRLGSVNAAAEAIGVSKTRVIRVRLGHPHEWSMDVVSLLRLAQATGEPPSKVLRAAGKNDVADLIEALYGDGAASLSPAEQRLLTKWRLLKPARRAHVQQLVDLL